MMISVAFTDFVSILILWVTETRRNLFYKHIYNYETWTARR